MPPFQTSGGDMTLGGYLLSVGGGSVLMGACYALGKFNYSVAWIGVFVFLKFLKSKLWRNRESRLLALRQTALREREVIMAQLKDLPAWVQFPDTERVEWLNKVSYDTFLAYAQ